MGDEQAIAPRVLRAAALGVATEASIQLRHRVQALAAALATDPEVVVAVALDQVGGTKADQLADPQAGKRVLEPTSRFELETSSLPRKCSAN